MKRNVKVILIISGSGHNFMVVALVYVIGKEIWSTDPICYKLN